MPGGKLNENRMNFQVVAIFEFSKTQLTLWTTLTRADQCTLSIPPCVRPCEQNTLFNCVSRYNLESLDEKSLF